MTARRPTRLPKWHEWSIYAAFGLLAATGVIWLILDQWVRVEGEFGPEHHPAEHLMLIGHGGAAYAILILTGALIPVHIKVGWSIGRNLKSGIGVAIALGLLGLTALALYYVSDDILRSWSSVAHWVVGFAAVPLLVVHAVRGRQGAIPRPTASRRPRGQPKRGG